MKRKKQKNYKINTTTDVEYMTVIKIAIGVLLVFGIVYLVTAISSGELKFNSNKNEKTETVIQYDEIIGGTIFNRSDKEYYVLLCDFTDKYYTDYLTAIKSYSSKDNSVAVYLVDLNKKINKNYLALEDDTINTSDISKLKVANPTLLKIANSKTVEVITGNEKIIELFNK